MLTTCLKFFNCFLAHLELNPNGSQILHELVSDHFFRLIPCHSSPLFCFNIHSGFLSESWTRFCLRAFAHATFSSFVLFPLRSLVGLVFLFWGGGGVPSSVAPPHGHVTIELPIPTLVVIRNHSTLLRFLQNTYYNYCFKIFIYCLFLSRLSSTIVHLILHFKTEHTPQHPACNWLLINKYWMNE